MAEYNAYHEAVAQTDPEEQIKLLDDFVSRYPASALLAFVYSQYAKAHSELRNFPKVIENVDRLIAMGDKVPLIERYAAHYRWADAYNRMDATDAVLASKAKDVALAGIKLLGILEKPLGMKDQDFAAEKKRGTIFFYTTAGIAALRAKDFPASFNCLKAIQSLEPYDPLPLIEPKPQAIPF